MFSGKKKHPLKQKKMNQVIKKQKMDIKLKSLEDLPEEIILKILGQVNIRDLFRCSFINKKIRRIAHDKSLWEKMNLCTQSKL